MQLQSTNDSSDKTVMTENRNETFEVEIIVIDAPFVICDVSDSLGIKRIKNIILRGCLPNSKHFPSDSFGKTFSDICFQSENINGGLRDRDWLVFTVRPSFSRGANFRLFHGKRR